ncbi:MAG: hypothetical protein Kow0065_20150 [Methylomicrobium sp.]
MSLFNFFKADKNVSACTIQPESITVETLKTLIPIRSLNEDLLASFATDRQSEVYPANTILFNQGEQNDSAYYLLKGTVIISDSTGKHYEVEADTARAKFPLCSGIKHALTVIAKTDVGILRVSEKIMRSPQPANHHPAPLNLPKQFANNRLLQAFSQYYLEEEMAVPSLPDIAFKLRKAIQADIGVAEAVKIIQLDPVIAAKLIQVANCPLYLAAIPAKTCLEAVNRIGLRATQNLVISLTLKQIFTSSNALIKKIMDRVWKQSIYVSSICYVLASETRKVNAEEALLGGLVCDIGSIPFLNFAANLPDDYYNQHDIEIGLPLIRGPVSAYILHEWNFPDELSELPLYAEDWYQHREDRLTLLDVIVLSRLHSKIGTPEMTELPPITSIPAASKLDFVQLSPENSLHILHDAQTKINEAKRAFLI